MTDLVSKPRFGRYRPTTRQIAITGDTELLLRKLAARTDDSVRAALVKAIQEKHRELDRAMRHRVEWSRKHRAAKPRALTGQIP
jgi:hypothetical protein